MARKINDDLGFPGERLPTTPDGHAFIKAKYDELLRQLGTDSSAAIVNCCTIAVKVDIIIRKDTAPATEGYHQIKVVPKGDTRSFVRLPWASYPSSHTTSGTWQDDPSGAWPPEAHEVGHIMGLPDEYSDNWIGSGATPYEGHETDLMANCLAYPQAEAFAAILKIHGFECNCCKEITPFVETFNTVMRTGNIAVANCDIATMNKTIADLVKEREDLYTAHIPLDVKSVILDRITSQLANIFEALDNCPPPAIVETTNVVIRLGYDAITSCNRDLIQEVILQLEARRRAIIAQVSLTADEKSNLMNAIDAMKARLEKALIDCPPITETSVVTGSDGETWCTYGSGTGWNFPLISVDGTGEPITPGDGPKIATGNPPGPVPITPRSTPSGTPIVPEQPKALGPPSSTPETPKTLQTTNKPEIPTKTPEPPRTTNGPPPPDKPVATTNTPPTNTPSNIPDTIFVKAKESVLEGGQTGNPIKGQVVKLFPPSKPPLPGSGGTKTAEDNGFDKPPAQCTTGSDGTCKIDVAKDERPIYRLPDGRPNRNYRLDYNLPSYSGGVVETTGKESKPDLTGLPNGANAIGSNIVIGNRTFMRLSLYQPFNTKFNGPGYFTPILDGNYQEDFCRDKQPGPPLGMQPNSFSALNHALPEAILRLNAVKQTRWH